MTPIGNSVNEFWESAIKGKTGASKITKFDPSLFKTTFASEIKNFTPENYLDRNEIKRSDPFTQYALCSVTEAFTDSGIDIESISPFDIGVIWGSGQGGMQTFEEEVKNFTKGGMNPRFNPFFIPKMLVNMASGMIAMKFGLMGINYTAVSACASSNSAIMDAFNYIRLNKAKVMVTGGSEAPITEASIGGFGSMKALSTRNDVPQQASRPFDVDRDGFVMGEGAGALILEEYEHAKKRGAIKAMQLAMEEAHLNPEQINYLNAHATSTPVGDISEMKAVVKTFNNDFKNLKISATKSMTGHLMGAAGAVEAILAIKAIQNNIIPPTINTVNIDPEIPKSLPIVLGDAMDSKINVAMSNTFGFGGHNGTVIFKKIQ